MTPDHTIRVVKFQCLAKWEVITVIQSNEINKLENKNKNFKNDLAIK